MADVPLRISGLTATAATSDGTEYAALDKSTWAAARKILTSDYFGSRVLNGNMLIVDSVNGGTGVVGSFTKSYLTLAAAKTDAASGDTIVVYPGTYNERDLLKNGVNWHFLPGANVTYTGSANGGIFDDSSDGANGAVTCAITGAGMFTHAGSGGAQDRNSCIRVTNSSSVVSIECRKATGSASGAFNQAAIRHTAGHLYFRSMEPITGTGLNYAVWWDAGDSHIHAPQFEATGGASGIYVTATGTSDLWIHGDKVTGQNGVEVASGNDNSRVYLRVDEIRGSGIGLRVEACKVYVEAVGKLSAADQPFLQDGGWLWLTALGKMSLDSGASSAQVTGGNFFGSIDHIEDLGCNDVCLDLAAATGTSVDCQVGKLITGADAVAGVRLNQTGTGVCSFKGTVNATLATAGNPVAIPASGTGTLLDGTILISASGRDSVVPDSSTATVNVYGVAYVTHAKNGSVTLGMGTLTTIAGMT